MDADELECGGEGIANSQTAEESYARGSFPREMSRAPRLNVKY